MRLNPSNNHSEEESIKKTKSLLPIGLVIFSVVIGIWLVGAVYMKGMWLENAEKAGLMGDMFGGITALFSGLAFAGLILTLLLQQRELRMQRNVLELQRQELTMQREEMERHRLEFKLQREAQEKSILMQRLSSRASFSIEVVDFNPNLKDVTPYMSYVDKLKGEFKIKFHKGEWFPSLLKLSMNESSPPLYDFDFDYRSSENVAIQVRNSVGMLGSGGSLKFIIWVKKATDIEKDSEPPVIRLFNFSMKYTTAAGDTITEPAQFTALLHPEISANCYSHSIDEPDFP